MTNHDLTPYIANIGKQLLGVKLIGAFAVYSHVIGVVIRADGVYYEVEEGEGSYEFYPVEALRLQ